MCTQEKVRVGFPYGAGNSQQNRLFPDVPDDFDTRHIAVSISQQPPLPFLQLCHFSPASAWEVQSPQASVNMGSPLQSVFPGWGGWLTSILGPQIKKDGSQDPEVGSVW